MAYVRQIVDKHGEIVHVKDNDIFNSNDIYPITNFNTDLEKIAGDLLLVRQLDGSTGEIANFIYTSMTLVPGGKEKYNSGKRAFYDNLDLMFALKARSCDVYYPNSDYFISKYHEIKTKKRTGQITADQLDRERIAFATSFIATTNKCIRLNEQTAQQYNVKVDQAKAMFS